MDISDGAKTSNKKLEVDIEREEGDDYVLDLKSTVCLIPIPLNSDITVNCLVQRAPNNC